MGEKNLDFDTVIDRQNTKSIKYDFAVERGMPKDIQPLWVADMDFKTSSYVIEALQKTVEHGIYGYSDTKEGYFAAVKNWMKKHFDWDVDASWLVKTPGVVYAVATAVRAFTKEGDAVLIQQPVYYPFSQAIVTNGRRLVNNELRQNQEGSYEIDFADFEKKVVEEQVKLFILCSPHNPVGRVWTKEELSKLGEICLRHQVLVVSDEIHADFAFEREHQVFTTVNEALREISMVCTAPSKTFNIAGLQVSNIFIANSELREKFLGEMNAGGYSQINLAGLVACEAAYEYGEEWLDGVRKYIQENIAYTNAFVAEKLPKVKVIPTEGTYLVWMDFRAYGLQDEVLNDKIVHEAGLWLDGGSMFGKAGEGFQRINVACPRSVLTQALEKLAIAFEY